MINFLNLSLAGLAIGGMYAIFSLAMVTLFRTAGLLNLAIGDFAMVGALGTAGLNQAGFPLVLAIVVVLSCIGLFGFTYDRLVIQTALDGRRSKDSVVAVFFFTIALSFFVENVGQHLFGNDVGAAKALWPGAALNWGGVHLQRTGLVVIILALVAGAGFAAYLQLTLNGKALSACGSNPFGARIVGIRQIVFRRRMFMTMSMVAGLFGIVVSPLIGFTYNSAGSLSLFGLLGGALAGFKKPGRAVVAGILIGLAETYLGGYVNTKFEDPLLYSVLVAAVLIRPQIVGHNVLANS